MRWLSMIGFAIRMYNTLYKLFVITITQIQTSISFCSKSALINDYASIKCMIVTLRGWPLCVRVYSLSVNQLNASPSSMHW